MAGEQGGLGSMKQWFVLTWETARGRKRIGNGGRLRERETHPLSHVFDRRVFPTGVKKGRADWAE